MRAAVRRAVAWRSGVQLGVQLLTWASTLIVLRLLAPADYGVMAMAQLVIGLLTLVAGQGFAAAAVAAPELTRDDVRRLLGVQLMLGVTLGMVQAAAAPLAAEWFREPRLVPLLQLLALAYPLATATALAAALRQRALDFRAAALVEGGAAVVQAAATLAVAAAGWGVWALAWGQLAGTAARALGWIAAGHGLARPLFRLGGARALVATGSLLTVNGLLFYGLAQAPVLIGGRILTPEAIGLYSTAFFLASLPAARFLPVLSEVGLAAYSRRRDDPAAFSDSFRLVTRVVAVSSFPLYLGLAATAPDAAPVLLGGQWAGAAPHFVGVGLAMPAYTLFCLFGPPSYALGRARVQTTVLLFALALMPAAFALGAARAGAIGLSAAWAVAFPLAAAFAAALTLPRIGVPWRAFLADFGRPLLAAVLMGAAVAALRPWLPDPPAVRLALCVGIGAAAYAGLVRLIARAAWEDAKGLARR